MPNATRVQFNHSLGYIADYVKQSVAAPNMLI
jgi:hypothetical protein